MSETTTKQKWNQKTREYDSYPVPKIISEYNKCHTFVDKVKSSVSRNCNLHKSRRAWRVKLNVWFYALLWDCFLFFKYSQKKKSSYTFRNFLTQVVHQLRTSKIVKFENSKAQKIVFHTLQPAKKQGRCLQCKKNTRRCCMDCSSSPLLHEGICNLTYHNNSVIITK